MNDRRGRYGDDERWQGNRYEREGGSFGSWGSGRGDWDRDRERSSWGDRDRGGWGGDRSRGGDDRGFMERAGEQVRSWFSDDDDRGGRGRYGDRDVHWERTERGNWRDDPVHFREGGFRGGERSQGETRWNQDRDFDRSRGQDRSRGMMGGRDDDQQGYARGGGSSWGGSRGAADTWGGSGFGGLDDNGRRFDRIDAGSTGTQGAHPMSSPVDAGYGMGAGIGAGGGYGSSARYAAIMQQSRGQQGHHDPHYSEWRQRQIDELDRDYDDYRREHQSKFDSEFGGWRQQRQSQRQMLGRVTEHMTVVGSDGEHVGTVDKVRGDKIILTKNDEKAGGVHHSIPCSWVETVDDKVTLNKSSDEAFRQWTDEDSNRALFERPDQGSDGPHMLNRSFSGTYDDNR
jgi:hypothetical protein